ncbi:MAG: DUF881 domain-containing protein [Bacillota bacterium]|nr:DUF881 domain-containing protein [Bacillota bacterium]
MKGNEMKVFTFIASILIGLLISFNISFGSNNAAVMVSSQEYMKLTDTKQQLLKDIMSVSEETRKNNIKLEKYQASTSSGVTKEMETELENTRLLLGTTPVSGQGIKITVKDHSYDTDITTNNALSIIHNSDLFTLVNTLRSKGAKAITINGIRVIGSSSIQCFGEFIDVDGIKLPAPFEICAIGNKEQLYNYIQNEDGPIQILRRMRDIFVLVEPSDNIVMPAYIPKLRDSYVKTVAN